MKALSVIMPWPWLIFRHGKNVENRTWRTDYRGAILVHASKKIDGLWAEILSKYNATLTNAEMNEYLKWYGCIIGTVDLVDCVKNEKSRWAEEGMWHWVLENPVEFKRLIPAKGSLGLWEYNGLLEQRKGENFL